MAVDSNPTAFWDGYPRWAMGETYHGMYPLADNSYGHGTPAARMLVNGYLPSNGLIMSGLLGPNTAASGSSTATVSVLPSTVTFGSKTIPAAALNAIGRMLKVKVTGIINNNATPGLTAILKLGSTTVLTSGNVTTVSMGAANMFSLDAWIMTVTTGATGTVYGNGTFLATANSFVIPAVSNAAVTVDLTGTLALDVTLAYDASHGSNAFRGMASFAEISLGNA